MVTLRCTKRLQKFLGVKPAEKLEPANTVLGDWYGNLIATPGGDLVLFVSDRTLLSVAIPAWEPHNLQGMLALRVGNLLGMLHIDAGKARVELDQFERIQIANTESRSVIGSMDDIAWHYYNFADHHEGQEKLSLSEAELYASQIPFKALKFRFPREVARDLFQQMSL